MSRAKVALAVILLLGGCVPDKSGKQSNSQDLKTKPFSAQISNTDACAMQMHDICGAFLLFYGSQNRLPRQLSELAAIGSLDSETHFVCPVSQQPYIYNPTGILLPEQNARIILYDPVASHSNFRWAISIHDPEPGQPLIAKVIALPDQFFIMQR